MTSVEHPDGWSFRVVRDDDDPYETTTPAQGSGLAALIDGYLADLRIRGRPETLRHARQALERLISGCELSELRDVTKARIEAWRRARVERGASHRTANHEVSILAAALNHAVRLGLIEVSPLAGLRPLPILARHRVRKARALTDDEIARLLGAAHRIDQGHPSWIPREPLLAALLSTAARYNEAVQATWGDLNVERRLIVLRAETTKSARARSIPLAVPEMQRLLALRELHERILGDLPGIGDRIFLTPKGTRWPSTTTNFHRFLHEAMRIGRVPYRDAHGRVLHVHALRHTAATRWARQGMPLLELQRLLGHTDPKLTAQVYIDAELELARRWISPLPRFGEGGTF